MSNQYSREPQDVINKLHAYRSRQLPFHDWFQLDTGQKTTNHLDGFVCNLLVVAKDVSQWDACRTLLLNLLKCVTSFGRLLSVRFCTRCYYIWVNHYFRCLEGAIRHWGCPIIQKRIMNTFANVKGRGQSPDDEPKRQKHDAPTNRVALCRDADECQPLLLLFGAKRIHVREIFPQRCLQISNVSGTTL